MRAYISMYNDLVPTDFRNLERDLVAIAPANADQLLTSMRSIIPRIIADPSACAAR
jgi:hypothetical protein